MLTGSRHTGWHSGDIRLRMSFQYSHIPPLKLDYLTATSHHLEGGGSITPTCTISADLSSPVCLSPRFGFSSSVNMTETGAPFFFWLSNYQNRREKTNNLLQLKNSQRQQIHFFFFLLDPHSLNPNSRPIEAVYLVFKDWTLQTIWYWHQNQISLSSATKCGSKHRSLRSFGSILDGRLASQLPIYCQKYASLSAAGLQWRKRRAWAVGSECVWERQGGRQRRALLRSVSYNL